MKKLLIFLFFFSSCSSYNTETITAQQITNSLNEASTSALDFLIENYDNLVVNKIIELYDSGNCELFNEFAINLNKLQCYIIAFNRVRNQDSFIIFLSVSNKLLIEITDLWHYVFSTELPRYLVRGSELTRRYIDNNNISLIEVNIFCNNETLPILDCEKI